MSALVTGIQTCALPISLAGPRLSGRARLAEAAERRPGGGLRALRCHRNPGLARAGAEGVGMDRQRRLQRHLDVLWAAGGFLAAAADRKRPADGPAARRAARRRRAPAAAGAVAGESGRAAWRE